MNGKKTGKNELYEKMKNCSKCGNGKYTPFCFKISSQKVAVITACPSMQAEYKPFTSIRFFRKMCIALFGDSNVSSQYIDAFFNDDGVAVSGNAEYIGLISCSTSKICSLGIKCYVVKIYAFNSVAAKVVCSIF